MKILKIIGAVAQILIAIALFAGVAVGFMAVNQFKTYTQAKIKADCALAYQKEFTAPAGDTTVKTPIEEEYQLCLEANGVSN